MQVWPEYDNESFDGVRSLMSEKEFSEERKC